MRLDEIKNFYKTASKTQIYRLVESRNTSNVKSEILTEMIYSANHREIWTSHSREAFKEHLKRLEERARGNSRD